MFHHQLGGIWTETNMLVAFETLHSSHV